MNARLSFKQAAEAIGTNLGTLIQMRAKGAKLFDPTFPPMTNGTFDAAEIAAWKTAKNVQSPVHGAPSQATPPIDTTAQGTKS
ncbi:hypothetical protein [Rhodoferax sp.]|uniref:hypothetical protein n=1 Tax=Rhodoferax sp. TaxID=50421 RepID=UPI002733CC75|nr:hypothetical protein [Rhodoferax sp.]MDP3335249.1 hypothetical protein [Rhodoferax sp.]